MRGGTACGSKRTSIESIKPKCPQWGGNTNTRWRNIKAKMHAHENKTKLWFANSKGRPNLLERYAVWLDNRPLSRVFQLSYNDLLVDDFSTLGCSFAQLTHILSIHKDSVPNLLQRPMQPLTSFCLLIETTKRSHQKFRLPRFEPKNRLLHRIPYFPRWV